MMNTILNKKISDEKNYLYNILQELNINFEEVEHLAVETIEEAERLNLPITGQGCKNLFMKDKENNYYLIIIVDTKKADIKYLQKLLKVSKLRFANEEELLEILGLQKGSVTPLGIINDKENKVTLLLDKDLKDKKLLFHPNINTKTISLNYNDLINFINSQSHKYFVF